MDSYISFIIHSSGNYLATNDTIDSIRFLFKGANILTILDGNYSHLAKKIDSSTVIGFREGTSKSPYRTVCLGLYLAATSFSSNWICYCDYDVLFNTDRILKQLKLAEKKRIWLLGFCGRICRETSKWQKFIEPIIKKKISASYYTLGCCKFYHKDFMKKLVDLSFFEKFLNLTNQFENGFFPYYREYDISEHLYSTLCMSLGGNIGILSSYDNESGKWHGSYTFYPVRWRPEIKKEEIDINKACILHPIKKYDDEIRSCRRDFRRRILLHR